MSLSNAEVYFLSKSQLYVTELDQFPDIWRISTLAESPLLTSQGLKDKSKAKMGARRCSLVKFS